MIINHPFLSSNHLNLFAYHYKYTTIFFSSLLSLFFFLEIKEIINKEPNKETLRIYIYIYPKLRENSIRFHQIGIQLESNFALCVPSNLIKFLNFCAK